MDLAKAGDYSIFEIRLAHFVGPFFRGTLTLRSPKKSSEFAAILSLFSELIDNNMLRRRRIFQAQSCPPQSLLTCFLSRAQWWPRGTAHSSNGDLLRRSANSADSVGRQVKTRLTAVKSGTLRRQLIPKFLTIITYRKSPHRRETSRPSRSDTAARTVELRVSIAQCAHFVGIK
jgi:hypothetical protein